jgi:microcystin degradation protein MlrC
MVLRNTHAAMCIPKAGRFFAAGVVTVLTGAAAFAADIPANSLKLAPGVAKAQGYETVTTTYVVANPTDIYSDHAFYDTKVMGQLQRGEKVDALAKVKGWEWVLVGKDGTGIGYVSISMLSPADKYIP